MKFLHISDLHIGKRISEFSMMEDQKHILNQILEIADREKIQGVIIAGDIYDRSVPSGEAVQVFDRFLTALAEKGKKVFIISGNHDCAERLAFGASLMNRGGVFISPVYTGTVEPVRLEDEYGELFLYLLPFIKPAVMRCVLEKEGEGNGEEQAEAQKQGTPGFPESYQDAAALAVERMKVDPSRRNILAAHQFVTGAGRCESEDISVGGLDNVDAEIFDVFDYVALGHIHSPQWVKRRQVRYCGTPLKYSFSEADQEKSVTVLDMREKGVVEISTSPLKPLHDMKKLRGSYEEVTLKSFYQGMDRQDYMQITLTDEEDIPDGFRKLRIIYPNLMQLIYDNSRTGGSQAIELEKEAEDKSELELFEEFFALQNNRSMSGKQEEWVRGLIEELKAGEESAE